MTETKLHFPTFDGSDEEAWAEFAPKIKNILKMKGVEDAIVEDLLKQRLTGSAEEKAQKKEENEKKNSKALMYLMAALKGDAFNIINSPVCEGNAYLQWQELEATYGTTTETDKNALIAKLAEVQFPSLGEDPSKTILKAILWNHEIGKIDAKAQMSEDVLLGQLMAKSRKEYQSIIETYKLNGMHYLDATGKAKPVTMAKFRIDMRAMWLEKFKGKKEKQDDDKAFNVTDPRKKGTYKPFNGNCKYCGRQGHKKKDCRKFLADERKKNKECYNCGEKGHYSRDCTKPKKSESAMNLFVGHVDFCQPVGASVRDEVDGDVVEIEDGAIMVGDVECPDVPEEEFTWNFAPGSVAERVARDEEVDELRDVLKRGLEESRGWTDVNNGKKRRKSEKLLAPNHKEPLNLKSENPFAALCDDDSDDDDSDVMMIDDETYAVNRDVPTLETEYEYSTYDEDALILAPVESWEELSDDDKMELDDDDDTMSDLLYGDLPKDLKKKSPPGCKPVDDSVLKDGEDFDDHSCFASDYDPNEPSDDTELEELLAMATNEKEHKTQKNQDNETDDDSNKYLIDSGASVSCGPFADNLIDVKEPKEPRFVMVGNGEKLPVTHVGTLLLKDEANDILEVKNYHVVPGLERNLISTSQMLMDGYTLESTLECTWIRKKRSPKKKAKLFRCDRDSKDGMYYFAAVRVTRKQADILTQGNTDACFAKDGKRIHWADVVAEVVNVTSGAYGKVPSTMDLNRAHDLFGHLGEPLLKKTLKIAGITPTGTLTSCEGCALTRAKQKALAKTTLLKATQPGERMFIDVAGPYPSTKKGTKYIASAVDDFSRWGMLAGLTTKSQLATWFEEQLLKLKAQGYKMKYIRCDNAGENLAGLKKVCDKHGLTMELTAPNTPQHNGVAERRLTLVMQRANAMMSNANFNDDAKQLLWAEACNHANDVTNVIAQTNLTTSPHEMFTKSKSKVYGTMQPFGRMGYVTIRTKIKNKWSEKSQKCVFVGMAKNHAADTYRMYNPATRKVIESRDVKWDDWKRLDPKRDMDIYNKISTELQEKPGIDDKEEIIVTLEDPQEPPPHVIPDDEGPAAAGADANGEEHQGAPESESGRNKEGSDDSNAVPNPKQVREMRRLEGFFNKDAQEFLSRTRSAGQRGGIVEADDDETVHFVFNVESMAEPGLPKNFKEAISGPDADKWIDAIGGEFMNFIKRKAWKKVPKSIPEKLGRKLLKGKHVFKIKDEQDGSQRYKDRYVTKGYLQKPGVDYQLSFSPVVTDSSIRTGIAVALYKSKEGWIIELIDIEAAFLEGLLDNPLWIEMPEGMVELGFATEEEAKTHCIELQKSMYGNVDSALRFFKEYKKKLEAMGMVQSLVDPCVFYKYDEEGKLVLIALVYVDDTVLIGAPEWVQWFKREIGGRFNFTELGPLKKHLGIWYEHLKDENGEPMIVARMPKMVDEIIELYEKEHGDIPQSKLYGTPGTPGKTLSKNDGDPINAEKYRSIVGKIMYLVTKLFVEGSNAARELSKHFSNPGEEHWDAVGRFVGYLKKHRQDIRLTYRVPIELRPVSMVDTDYATNKEDRKSITGTIHTVGGTITAWQSKSQATVTLSSTEAEYIGMASGLQEILFMHMLLDEIDGSIRPGVEVEDNQGAMFLVKNQSVGPRTKHIDVRHHFIRQHYENGDVDAVYTRSENNEADINTKNLPEALQMKHAEKIRNGMLYVREHWDEMMQDIATKKVA